MNRYLLKNTILCLLLACTLEGKGQSYLPLAANPNPTDISQRKQKTYLGFELVVANDIYKITDSGHYLKSVPLYNVAWGIHGRQEVNEKLFLEAGFVVKYYQEGFGFETMPYYSYTSSDASWLIPIRGGFNVNLYKRKVFFVPVVGYTFGINPSFGYGWGYGKQESNTTSIVYSKMENEDVSRFFSLLQLGAGFEIKIRKTLLVNLSMNYYKGFNTITQLDINYVVDNTTPQTGTASSKGDFWCVDLGVKYPISNFWQK